MRQIKTQKYSKNNKKIMYLCLNLTLFLRNISNFTLNNTFYAY